MKRKMTTWERQAAQKRRDMAAAAILGGILAMSLAGLLLVMIAGG